MDAITDSDTLTQELESVNHCQAVIDQGLFAFTNAPLRELLGYDSADDLMSVTLLDVAENLDKEQLKAFTQKASKSPSEKATLVSATLRHKNGEVIICELQGQAIEVDGETMILCTFLSKEADVITDKHTRKGKATVLKAWLAIAVLLATTLICAWQLQYLVINNVPKVYLPPDSPGLIADDEARKYFPGDQGMIFLFEGIALFSDSFLNALDELTETLRDRDDIERTYSVTRQDHIASSADGFYVHPLLNTEELEDLNEEERLEFALADPFAPGALISESGDSLALVVIPEQIDDSFKRLTLQTEIHQLIRDAGIENYLVAEAGHVTTDVEQAREFLRQLAVFVPMTVVLGLGLLWTLFRRMLALAVSAGALMCVSAAVVSLYAIIGTPFNLISSILPTLMMALTIAALVHLFNAVQYASRRGQVKQDRIRMATNQISKPALFNALTTMAGFASLGLSDVPPIRALGIYAAIGLGLIYVVVYLILPFVLAAFDNKPWPVKAAKLAILNAPVQFTYKLGVRHPIKTLVIGGALVATPAALYLGNVKAETNLLEFFAEGHKVRTATEHVQAKLAGTGSLELVIKPKIVEDLRDPDALKAIKELQDWLEQQPEIDKARSLADFIAEMNRGFHEARDEYRVIPDNPDLVAQYVFVYDGEDLYDFVDEDFQVTRITLNINTHGATEVTLLMNKLRSHLQHNFTPSLSWEIIGISRIFADQSELLVSGQVKSILGALVIILILMIAQWRSLLDSLICMIPNLSPALLIFILMGALNIWLDVATAMIASIAVGIAIDDTIHIYHGFIHRVRKGISPVLAIARTYRHAGKAVMTTTIILCSQFAILASSNFVPIQNFGILTSVGMAAALIFDLLFLPAFMILCYARYKHKPEKAPGN